MGPPAYADALALPPGRSRVLLVVAHPDDETIGAGGLLWAAGRHGRAAEPTAPDAELDLHLLHLTDGAPRDGRDAAAAGCATAADYALKRREELAAALAAAGVPPDRAGTLGCIDQEAALHLPALSRALADRLAALRPDLVLTHAYEGGHPDHDAAAFAVRAACALLRRAGGPAPRIVEMPFYHAADGGMAVQAFLPGGDAGRVVRLDADARAAKRRMLDAHVSQARVLAPFTVDAERFRPAPRHLFDRPPHGGPLMYELWGFTMTGLHWRRLADEALAALGLEDARCH
ncbi:PIG-L deacetylase family protein [Azospirillum sp. ST 5-10]|uniref:PIG-L deacetylase family protein n=1 Tax=unclassified Azospirillum TaxID=2630922 RepID=UPI003F49F4DB